MLNVFSIESFANILHETVRNIRQKLKRREPSQKQFW